MRTLIYPERRQISDDKIISWALDVLCDDEVLEHQMSGCECERGMHETNVAKPSLDEAIELLEDRGVATFQKLLTGADLSEDYPSQRISGPADAREPDIKTIRVNGILVESVTDCRWDPEAPVKTTVNLNGRFIGAFTNPRTAMSYAMLRIARKQF